MVSFGVGLWKEGVGVQWCDSQWRIGWPLMYPPPSIYMPSTNWEKEKARERTPRGWCHTTVECWTCAQLFPVSARQLCNTILPATATPKQMFAFVHTNVNSPQGPKALDSFPLVHSAWNVSAGAKHIFHVCGDNFHFLSPSAKREINLSPIGSRKRRAVKSLI